MQYLVDLFQIEWLAVKNNVKDDNRNNARYAVLCRFMIDWKRKWPLVSKEAYWLIVEDDSNGWDDLNNENWSAGVFGLDVHSGIIVIKIMYYQNKHRNFYNLLNKKTLISEEKLMISLNSKPPSHFYSWLDFYLLSWRYSESCHQINWGPLSHHLKLFDPRTIKSRRAWPD